MQSEKGLSKPDKILSSKKMVFITKKAIFFVLWDKHPIKHSQGWGKDHRKSHKIIYISFKKDGYSTEFTSHAPHR
jgi:hypothetical protein